MKKTIRIGRAEKTIELDRTKSGGFEVTVDGKSYEVADASVSDGVMNFFIGTRSYRAVVSRNPMGLQVSINGCDYVATGEAEDRGRRGAHHHGDGTVEAPMPGNIVAVNVGVGETVKPGDSLVILESMKMQNDITAPVGGKVRAINCKVGDQVGFGHILAEIQK